MRDCKKGDATLIKQSSSSSTPQHIENNYEPVCQEVRKETNTKSLVDTSREEPPNDCSKNVKCPSSIKQAVLACLLCSFCSVSMVLVNKSLTSSYSHLLSGDLNFLLVVFQNIVAVVAVSFAKYMSWVDYPSFSLHIARQWAPVNVLFCIMLFSAMTSFQLNNIPMVMMFKSITNILIAAGDKYFFGMDFEFLVMVSFGIMFLGAVAAAVNDIHVTVVGLFWMVTNCVSTAGYVLSTKFSMKKMKLSKFGMVFYNNMLCMVFLLPVIMMNGEISLFLNTPAIHTFDYFWKNVFAGLVGFALNFANLNCVSQAGLSAYALVSSLNKIPTSILGWILFGAEITGKTWFFIAVSMAGGFLYSYAKLSASMKKKVL